MHPALQEIQYELYGCSWIGEYELAKVRRILRKHFGQSDSFTVKRENPSTEGYPGWVALEITALTDEGAKFLKQVLQDEH